MIKMMDESSNFGLDLYDDLITNEGQSKQDSYDQLYEQHQEALAKISQLEKEVTVLKESEQKCKDKCQTLERNISVLFVTARRELERKEKEAAQLRNRNKKRPQRNYRPDREIDRNKFLERAHHRNTSDSTVVSRDLRSAIQAKRKLDDDDDDVNVDNSRSFQDSKRPRLSISTCKNESSNDRTKQKNSQEKAKKLVEKSKKDMRRRSGSVVPDIDSKKKSPTNYSYKTHQSNRGQLNSELKRDKKDKYRSMVTTSGNSSREIEKISERQPREKDTKQKSFSKNLKDSCKKRESQNYHETPSVPKSRTENKNLLSSLKSIVLSKTKENCPNNEQTIVSSKVVDISKKKGKPKDLKSLAACYSASNESKKTEKCEHSNLTEPDNSSDSTKKRVIKPNKVSKLEITKTDHSDVERAHASEKYANVNDSITAVQEVVDESTMSTVSLNDTRTIVLKTDAEADTKYESALDSRKIILKSKSTVSNIGRDLQTTDNNILAGKIIKIKEDVEKSPSLSQQYDHRTKDSQNSVSKGQDKKTDNIKPIETMVEDICEVIETKVATGDHFHMDSTLKPKEEKHFSPVKRLHTDANSKGISPILWGKKEHVKLQTANQEASLSRKALCSEDIEDGNKGTHYPATEVPIKTCEDKKEKNNKVFKENEIVCSEIKETKMKISKKETDFSSEKVIHNGEMSGEKHMSKKDISKDRESTNEKSTKDSDSYRIESSRDGKIAEKKRSRDRERHSQERDLDRSRIKLSKGLNDKRKSRERDLTDKKNRVEKKFTDKKPSRERDLSARNDSSDRDKKLSRERDLTAKLDKTDKKLSRECGMTDKNHAKDLSRSRRDLSTERERSRNSRERTKHSRERERSRYSQERERSKHLREKESSKHSRERERSRNSRERSKHSTEKERSEHSRERERSRNSRERSKHSREIVSSRHSREREREMISREKSRHSRERERSRNSRERSKHSREKESSRHSREREREMLSREKSRHSRGRERSRHSRDKDSSRSSKDHSSSPKGGKRTFSDLREKLLSARKASRIHRNGENNRSQNDSPCSKHPRSHVKNDDKGFKRELPRHSTSTPVKHCSDTDDINESCMEDNNVDIQFEETNIVLTSDDNYSDQESTMRNNSSHEGECEFEDIYVDSVNATESYERDTSDSFRIETSTSLTSFSKNSSTLDRSDSSFFSSKDKQRLEISLSTSSDQNDSWEYDDEDMSPNTTIESKKDCNKDKHLENLDESILQNQLNYLDDVVMKDSSHCDNKDDTSSHESDIGDHETSGDYDDAKHFTDSDSESYSSHGNEDSPDEESFYESSFNKEQSCEEDGDKSKYNGIDKENRSSNMFESNESSSSQKCNSDTKVKSNQRSRNTNSNPVGTVDCGKIKNRKSSVTSETISVCSNVCCFHEKGSENNVSDCHISNTDHDKLSVQLDRTDLHKRKPYENVVRNLVNASTVSKIQNVKPCSNTHIMLLANSGEDVAMSGRRFGDINLSDSSVESERDNAVGNDTSFVPLSSNPESSYSDHVLDKTYSITSQNTSKESEDSLASSLEGNDKAKMENCTIPSRMSEIIDSDIESLAKQEERKEKIAVADDLSKSTAKLEVKTIAGGSNISCAAEIQLDTSIDIYGELDYEEESETSINQCIESKTMSTPFSNDLDETIEEGEILSDCSDNEVYESKRPPVTDYLGSVNHKDRERKVNERSSVKLGEKRSRDRVLSSKHYSDHDAGRKARTRLEHKSNTPSGKHSCRDSKRPTVQGKYLSSDKTLVRSSKSRSEGLLDERKDRDLMKKSYDRKDCQKRDTENIKLIDGKLAKSLVWSSRGSKEIKIPLEKYGSGVSSSGSSKSLGKCDSKRVSSSHSSKSQPKCESRVSSTSIKHNLQERRHDCKYSDSIGKDTHKKGTGKGDYSSN